VWLFPLIVITFAIVHLPALAHFPWLATIGDKAAWSLAVALFGTGISHAVVPHYYLEMMPDWYPMKLGLIYVSSVLRFSTSVALLFPAGRVAASIVLLVLLCAVIPVNIRGALDNATRFYQLRLVFQVAWLGWTIWVLVGAIRV
jgi:uncharacterized membrane protein